MAKPLVNIYMGQAAVVDLTAYNLYSAQFSSCCPVVMFNNTNNKASYYHMPGKTVRGVSTIGNLSREDWQIIEWMAAAVNPTKVWIFPGHSVSQQVQAREPMQKALNTRLLALHLAETPLKIPQKTKVGLAVTMPGDKITFSAYAPAYDAGKWFDSQRERDKRPAEDILFWGWDIDVSSWLPLL